MFESGELSYSFSYMKDIINMDELNNFILQTLKDDSKEKKITELLENYLVSYKEYIKKINT